MCRERISICKPFEGVFFFFYFLPCFDKDKLLEVIVKSFAKACPPGIRKAEFVSHRKGKGGIRKAEFVGHRKGKGERAYLSFIKL